VSFFAIAGSVVVFDFWCALTRMRSPGNTNSATMDGTGAGGFDLLGGDLLGGIGGMCTDNRNETSVVC
jgi:hypothetical protein